MAGMPAYRYDQETAAPSRRPGSRRAPDITVLPGTRSTENPGLSSLAILAINVLIVFIAAFLVFGIARVVVTSAALDVANQASQMRDGIADERAVQESLAVEKSASANPISLREKAAGELQMAAPVAIESMSLPVDVVAYDDAGNLSLTDSVARLSEIS